jgi:hypothetical protein
MSNIQDEEKSSMAVANGKRLSASEGETTSESDISPVAFDKALEKRLVRKLDFVLLPWLALMYFFNSVDRSNLGNAKTDGMDVSTDKPSCCVKRRTVEAETNG